MPLTEDARNELREAIRIVREDRFEKYVRSRLPKNDPPKDPKDPLIDDDPKDPPKDPPADPPPPKDDPKDPPKEPRKSAWWGELMDD